MPSIKPGTDRYLAYLDKHYGQDAVYHQNTGQTVIDIITGDVTVVFNDIPVKVRSAGLTSIELAELSNSGLGQIDASWLVRASYVVEPKSDDLLTINSFVYDVIPNGVSLDAMSLLYTLMTRRRR